MAQPPKGETPANSLTPEQFARVRAIFESALERPTSERAAFLTAICGSDSVLLREVQAMLAAEDHTNTLLPREQPKQSTPSSSSSLEEGRFPAGTVLAGRYRILGMLGRGGMGEVYKAFDLILNQTVALKFLLPTHFSESALVRFRNEVRIARQVSHPNVARVYDLGMVEGLHFLSMEYIDGEDLTSLLRRIGRLPQDKAMEFTRKICAGLGAAHERGVLHRDLKPANIMIDGRGQPRITDFGLAGLAQEIPLSDIRSGTPAYMSPEQKAGKEVTTRSDLYSLGLVLYEMFTGRQRAGTQTNPSELVKDLDPAIERLILRCLDDDPKRRPSSALSVAMALPGADPIAAALAAGETPSPEMVAASQEKEGFSVRTAILCFVATVVFLAAGFYLSSRMSLLNKTPLDTPPDVMVFRIQEMLKQLGYPDPPARARYGFRFSPDALPNAVSEKELQFWYRQHVDRFYADALVQAARNGRVGYDSPAFLEPGMIRLVVSPEVRLIHLEALPRPRESVAPGEPDWPALFTLAGLDISRFRAVPPEAVPPIAADTRAAWIGSGPDEVRVEAAAWRGRVVYFSAVRTPKEAAAGTDYALFGGAGLLVLFVVTPPLLAWNNLRKGRADRTGAVGIAWVIFITWAVPWFIGAEHVAAPWEFVVLVTGVLEAGAYALLAYCSYLALEPYVRKLWPDSLISWSRVRSTRVNDPLVASHVLVGIAAMCVWHIFGGPGLARIAGATAEVPWPDVIGELHNGAFPIIHFSLYASAGIAILLSSLVAVVALRMLLRKIWIADTVFAITFGAGFVPLYFGDDPSVGYVMIGHAIVRSGILLWLVRRFGLLAGAAGLMTFYLSHVPYVPGTWFAARTLPVLLVPAVVAGWALWVIVRTQRPSSDSLPQA